MCTASDVPYRSLSLQFGCCCSLMVSICNSLVEARTADMDLLHSAIADADHWGAKTILRAHWGHAWSHLTAVWGGWFWTNCTAAEFHASLAITAHDVCSHPGQKWWDCVYSGWIGQPSWWWLRAEALLSRQGWMQTLEKAHALAMQQLERMQHDTCNMIHATWYMQHGTCNMIHGASSALQSCVTWHRQSRLKVKRSMHGHACSSALPAICTLIWPFLSAFSPIASMSRWLWWQIQAC